MVNNMWEWIFAATGWACELGKEKMSLVRACIGTVSSIALLMDYAGFVGRRGEWCEKI